jgi:hypothetical protein
VVVVEEQTTNPNLQACFQGSLVPRSWESMQGTLSWESRPDIRRRRNSESK